MISLVFSGLHTAKYRISNTISGNHTLSTSSVTVILRAAEHHQVHKPLFNWRDISFTKHFLVDQFLR